MKVGAVAVVRVAVLLCCASCGRIPEAWSTRPVPAAPAPPPPVVPLSNARIAVEVIDASNDARRHEGVPVIVSNDAMNRAAQEYAIELAGRREIEHVSQTRGKEDPAARLNAVGVQWTRVGENLGLLSPRNGIAQETVRMWLASPGHRHNLLNPLFRITGAGVARDAEGTYYVVQMYATP